MQDLFILLTTIMLDPLFSIAFEFFSVLLGFISVWDILGLFV